MVIIETNVYKYFMANLFEPNHFIEVSEDYFDNTVVKFRDQYSMVRVSGSEVLFINKSNEFDIVKRVTTSGVRVC